MHGFLEADMGEKPALQPTAAIGPAVRADRGAASLPMRARAIADPERSDQDAVHDFRRAMKQWRALMRLLEPFIPDAVRLRQEARDHARSLARARDGQRRSTPSMASRQERLVLSERSRETIRSRIEALRGSEEQAVLTPGLRDAIVAWLDTAAAGDRAVAARSVRLLLRSRHNSPKATAMRAGAFRRTGPRPAPTNCIRCASAWSTCAIRWNWSSRCGRASAACGPRKRNGCATGSAAVRTSKCSSVSPDRISPWRIGARV